MIRKKNKDVLDPQVALNRLAGIKKLSRQEKMQCVRAVEVEISTLKEIICNLDYKLDMIKNMYK